MRRAMLQISYFYSIFLSVIPCELEGLRYLCHKISGRVKLERNTRGVDRHAIEDAG